MIEEELIEQLADKEHASWARWMQYLFSKCQVLTLVEGEKIIADGFLIPYSLVERWSGQVETAYVDLSEAEKESDRKEVREILPIIRTYVESQR